MLIPVLIGRSLEANTILGDTVKASESIHSAAMEIKTFSSPSNCSQTF